MKLKIKIDEVKLKKALKERKKEGESFIAEEWKDYYFQPYHSSSYIHKLRKLAKQ